MGNPNNNEIQNEWKLAMNCNPTAIQQSLRAANEENVQDLLKKVTFKESAGKLKTKKFVADKSEKQKPLLKVKKAPVEETENLAETEELVEPPQSDDTQVMYSAIAMTGGLLGLMGGVVAVSQKKEIEK